MGILGGKGFASHIMRPAGTGEFMIYKFPETDFNTNTKLTVEPGDTAVFIKGGKIEMVTENGEYVLSNENIPFIRKLRDTFFGGESAFQCSVYFFRKADSREIKWATKTPLKVRDMRVGNFDGTGGIEVSIGGAGAYKLRIEDPKVFLTKLAGNIEVLGQDATIYKYFEEEFMGEIRSSLTRSIKEAQKEHDLIGMEDKIKEFGAKVQPFMDEILADYGLKMVKFSISRLTIIDDNGLRQQYDQMNMDAMKKVRNAQSDLGVMNTLGDKWQAQQQRDIALTLAANEGAGGAAAGMGMGMGVGMGNMFGGQMFNQMQQQQQAPAQSAVADDPVAKLKKLKEMLELGLIEQAEFDSKKAEIMSKM